VMCQASSGVNPHSLVIDASTVNPLSTSVNRQRQPSVNPPQQGGLFVGDRPSSASQVARASPVGRWGELGQTEGTFHKCTKAPCRS